MERSCALDGETNVNNAQFFYKRVHQIKVLIKKKSTTVDELYFKQCKKYIIHYLN